MNASPSERGARVRFPPPLVFISGLILGVVLGRVATPAPAPLDRTASLVIGILVLLVGVGFIAAAHLHFRRTGQNPIPWTPSPSLIAQGPYRFTRNPMYLGMTLIQTGLGLAMNNLWISVLAIPALLVVHLIAVLPEERYLLEKFGQGYQAYMNQVRRYL
jgi:protein-S-isoprenylcysteine O-methyltransferase Ste14